MKHKVGDRVRIKSIDWYNENKNKIGFICFDHANFIPEMSRYCGEILTINRVVEEFEQYLVSECAFSWTDEMIEGLVEEENKPKFKVGDEVRIKGTDIGGTIESVIRGQLIVNSKGSKIPAWPEDVVLMKSVEEETALNKWTGLKVELELSKSVIGVSNIESLRGERFMSGFVKAIIPPEGYQFVDENGNIINATKIVLEKKKKEYPKKFVDCCTILYPNDNFQVVSQRVKGHKGDLLFHFQKLIICRDAYWKIAGEEMGLGKPWEPDWLDDNLKPCIGTASNEIIKCTSYSDNTILAFPTAEMRDKFYENFKEEIEMCKELL